MARMICVYCSASDHVDDIYIHAAVELGRLMAQRGWTLVYGGGNIGLMGRLAHAIHAHGGRVVGVIPQSMVEQEVAYHQADELIVTHTMRQRKQIMEERAQAFVVLPGGFGTLEEFLEILTLRLLRFHDKPIVLINVAGFYDGLLAFFEHLIEERFAKARHRGGFHVAPTPAEALAWLDGFSSHG